LSPVFSFRGQFFGHDEEFGLEPLLGEIKKAFSDNRLAYHLALIIYLPRKMHML
jgi:hypothetical protein